MAQILSSKAAAEQTSSSREEDDILHRSAKKVKSRAECEAGGDDCMAIEEWSKLGSTKEKPWTNGQSFAERLQGINRKESREGVVREKDVLVDDNLSDTIS